MQRAKIQNIKTFVFDLDNTLYPPEVALFDQIEIKMTQYVMDALSVDKDEADKLRAQYWAQYGTTLAGLMDVHGVDPAPYLHEVHDIDFTVIPKDEDLAQAIDRLAGDKYIYTNGTAAYAEQVIAARGLDGLFDGIFGVEDANFRPKPERVAFENVFSKIGLSPSASVMFEDDARNLEAPKSIGLATVHVAPEPLARDFIDDHTDDLTAFLSERYQ